MLAIPIVWILTCDAIGEFMQVGLTGENRAFVGERCDDGGVPAGWFADVREKS
jgi:hypothetical protein